MPNGFERLCTDLNGPLVLLLLSKRCNSLMMISAWRWSGSYVMPESVQRTVRFRTRISFSITLSRPSTLAVISNVLSITLRIQLKTFIQPVIVKSSPCTDKKSSFCLRKKLHGDARPDLKPILSRNSVYSPESSSAPRHVSRAGLISIGYHVFSPGSKSSISISMYTSLRDGIEVGPLDVHRHDSIRLLVGTDCLRPKADDLMASSGGAAVKEVKP